MTPSAADGDPRAGRTGRRGQSGGARARHGLLVRTLALVLGAIAAGAAASALPSCGRSVPNVLLVVLDTTRADRCSVHGYDRPTTPRLEALARDGVVFDDAWSPAPWTIPAHGTLFTGLHPTLHGLGPKGIRILPREQVTVAERLRGKGVRTGLFSANPFVSATFGLSRGFDTDARSHEQPREDLPPPPATRITGEARRWIADRTDAGEPWFACLNLCDPHAPYDPEERFAARLRRTSAAAEPSEPALRALRHPETAAISLGAAPPLTPSQRERLSDLYDAEIAAADDALGDLLDGLDEDGVLDDTLVVVVGDHGEGLLDHGWIEHGGYLYRELLRVPLVVRFPGRFEGGLRRTDLVRLEDVAATILDVHGIALPAVPGAGVPLDLPVGDPRRPRIAYGTEEAQPALVDLIRRRNWPVDDRRFRRSRTSVYDGRWHLVADSAGRLELFDTARDPFEREDLSLRLPDEVLRLRTLLDLSPR